MIYQTDLELTPAIFHWGCYLMALSERLTTKFGIPFTHESILALVGFGQTYGLIDEQMTILDPQGLCDDRVGKGRVLFEGKRTEDFQCAPAEFEILCFHKDGASFNHFVSGDGTGKVIYDPWSSLGSDSVKKGNLIGKRIFRLL